jgi:hypothetical protein
LLNAPGVRLGLSGGGRRPHHAVLPIISSIARIIDNGSRVARRPVRTHFRGQGRNFYDYAT